MNEEEGGEAVVGKSAVFHPYPVHLYVHSFGKNIYFCYYYTKYLYFIILDGTKNLQPWKVNILLKKKFIF